MTYTIRNFSLSIRDPAHIGSMKNLRLTSHDLTGRAVPDEPAKRGNRQTRTPEILAIAARLFAREGYAAFTTRRVAAEAGLRLSTLQHYFPTRDALLHATIESLVERYHGRFRATSEDATLAPEARLDALLDFIFDAFVDPDTAAFWVEVWAMARHEPVATPLDIRAYEDGTRYLEGLIAQMTPSLSEEECAIRARLISVQIEGLLALVRRYRHDLPHRDAFLTALRQVCRAVARAEA
ncbi:TetR/AcrR family transcriptional regulator [Cupriavidus necator]